MTYYDLVIMSGNRTTDFRQRDMHAAHDAYAPLGNRTTDFRQRDMHAYAPYFHFKLADNEHL